MKISTIYQLLEYQASCPAFSAAVLAPNRAPLTFERLLAEVREAVACLNNLGIHRNDKVAIVLPNGPEMAVAFLSVACGAIAAPLNPAYSAAEFEFYLSDLDARALIVQAGLASPAIDVARGRGVPIIEIAPTAKGLSENKHFWVEATPNSFIPGFADQLIGAQAGDKRTVAVDFSADFVTPQLAGKKGSYEVEVTEVKEKVLPALDEALAKSYGAESRENLQIGRAHV